VADLPSPTTSSLVRRTHAGIRRSIGTAQTAKAPAVVTDLKRMLTKLPNTRVGTRDRALLLLGFAGAFRRSELVALDVDDLEFSSAGLVVTLRRAKTDQEGRSRRIGIPYGSSENTCPVRSLQAWLESARISEGPVFRLVSSVEAYDPTTGTWITQAALPTPTDDMGAARGGDGKIYMIGGRSPTNGYLTTVDAYDPTTNTWTTVAPMPTGEPSIS
jgi:hypothetical protein